MKKNTAVSIGSLALIEKVDGEYQFFSRIFNDIGGKARNLTPSTKLFIYNRLDECFSINQIMSGYSPDLFELLKFKKILSDRTLYRELCKNSILWYFSFIFIYNLHQKLIKK